MDDFELRFLCLLSTSVLATTDFCWMRQSSVALLRDARSYKRYSVGKDPYDLLVERELRWHKNVTNHEDCRLRLHPAGRRGLGLQ